MTTTSFVLEGLTCSSCLAEALEAIFEVDGVTRVAVDLVAGGGSPAVVDGSAPLTVGDLRAAVGRVGFGLVELPPAAAR
ncbi:heavy-metal-associated domain-containing protein [Cellulomonas oligotrophica]|uniref:Copper chaperone CopZ n=1 Tax=Cellulomonas oligotrophica TaxID=931536 RepID=A0A7Y9FH29_9CELL|nr:heavy-metal-associated domain-containing protein [Cellulomonas oligotrophica]NYD87206.1 copper chaperone CopZ [Cellulomonas oligotrophica]GIG33986.1 hypothetical protein Col01nite_31450 [Cellulomonas oligotrophica]